MNAPAPAPPETMTAETVDYYHIPAERRPTVLPGLILGLLGLGLVFLGGCFMIGLLIVYSEPPAAGAQGVGVYVAVLYTLAGGCFAGAILLMVLAVRSLLRVAKG